MHLVDVALFLHVVVAILAFSVAALLHTIQWGTRGATSTAQLKAWNPIAHRLEPMFPILALVLFGLGAWLIGLSDGHFAWSDGWVITAVVGLAVMELVGAVLVMQRAKNALRAVDQAPDGPVDDTLRRFVLNPVLWAATHFATGTALGILYLMSAKPSGLTSVVVVVACGAAGAALGAAGARTRATVREVAAATA
jgi:hypothetical protein